LRCFRTEIGLPGTGTEPSLWNSTTSSKGKKGGKVKKATTAPAEELEMNGMKKGRKNVRARKFLQFAHTLNTQ
jgi:hypothetical protein